MSRGILLAIGLTLLIGSARGDDATIARQLEALGGKVTIKDGSVTQVTLSECSKLGANEFQAIGQLAHLKSLTLYNNCTGLTDESLIHIAKLKELEFLGTDRIMVSDEGMKPLAELQNLRTAAFFHTSYRKAGFTGVGFGYLQACPKLEKLTVAGLSVGDECFAAIAKIQQLREFSTWHTHQTEAGNAEIARLTNLRALKVGQRLPRAGAAPSLSDASLEVLVSLKSLDNLQLGEAHFTVDKLTAALSSLPQLKQLTLFETDLAAADVEKLRAALPALKIAWQPLTDEQRKKFEQYLR